MGFECTRYVTRSAAALGFGRHRRSARMPDAVEVIAHRGASADAPENTLTAFSRALAQGARAVELDVQLSRDDVLIVFHDPVLDEKTSATGRVRERNAAELLDLEVGAWFDALHPDRSERFAGTRLVSLAEVLDCFGDRLHYHIEIKSPEAVVAPKLLAAIAERGLAGRVTVTSFDTEALLRLRELDRGVPICQLIRPVARLREDAMNRSLVQDLRGSTLLRRELDRAAVNGFDQVALPARNLDSWIVAHARRRGLGIRAWQVRSEEDVDRAIAAGADGVTVDWPERAVARIAAHGAASTSRSSPRNESD
jgi:glycerophosphoryl diester phosphodiesterase